MTDEQKKIYATEGDIIKVPDVVNAEIVNIELKKASAIFGVNAKKPEQEVYLLSVFSNEYDIGFNEPINKYEKIPDNSKLGKFLTKYHKLVEGTKVIITKDGNFWKIVL